jgi:nucleotide-binding universal stress UspA family protein
MHGLRPTQDLHSVYLPVAELAALRAAARSLHTEDSMSIVCGTDFSEASRPALITAAALAAPLGRGELYLVNVLDSGLTDELTLSQQQELEAKLTAKLEALAKEIAPGLNVKAAVVAGQPGSGLCEFAEKMSADLLVVASQGHSRSSMLHLGGVSERVAASAGIPVLVVRDEKPFLSWLKSQRRLRVLVGVDWTASSQPAIDLVKALRRAAPCDVIVGHVYYGSESLSRYGLPGTHSWVVRDAKTEELICRDLAESTGEFGGEGTVSFEPALGIGRVGEHLIDLAEAQRADVIVVGTHHRRGPLRLGSVSSVVLHHSHSSVICAPTKAQHVGERPVIRNVLVTTDLSPASNAAIAHGYAMLSGRHGAEVHLLHVAEPGEGTRAAAQEDSQIVARLRELVPKWAAREGIVTHTEVVHRSDVAKAIRGVASRIGADVVCMASHGRSGVGRIVLGSVAEEVLREETRPVLIVRSQPE